MEPHPFPLRSGEGTRLVPDPVLDGDPAEVVNKPRPPKIFAGGGVESGVAARLLGERGDPAGVAADPGRFEVGEIGEGGEHRIERVRPDGGHRFRLGRQGGLPLVCLVEIDAHVGSHPLEGLDHRGVVRSARSLAHPLPGVVAQHGCEVGVPSHRDDAYRQGDLVALEPGGVPLSVPALVGMGEGVDHRRLQTGASGQHGGDLAVRGQRPFVALRIGEPTSNQQEAPHPGLAGTDPAHEPSHHLPTRAHEDRSHRGEKAYVVTTDHGGGLRRVGRATQEAEKRKLMDGADLVGTAPHLLGDGGGDRAGAQGVAEGLTGPEIRGKRHRGEELDQTERMGRRAVVRADHESKRYPT